MKHIVELQYTNPSHEHVSLRRRVETVNRVVEAQSEEEALNRAANQQRALGFRIQSANIIEQKVEESKTEVLSEDVELDEGKVAKALAVGAMSLASMGAKAHTDTTKSVAQLAQERPALAQRLHDIGASGQVPASDKRAAELQRKQDQEMPASERRAKELKKEEVEQVDEARGYKIEPKESPVFKGSRANPMMRHFSVSVGNKEVGWLEHDKDDDTVRGSLHGKSVNISRHKGDTVADKFKSYINQMKEEAEQVDEGSKRMSAAVKLQRAFDREKAASDASRKRGEEVLAQARAEYAKKQAAKTNEEVEQVDEAKLNQVATFVPLKKHIENKSLRNAIHIPVNFVHGDKSHKEKLVKKVGAEKAAMYKLHGVFPRKLGEEIEQVDEANMRFDPEAAARPKSSDVKNFLNRDKNARAGAASKKYIRRMTKLGGLGPNQTKKDTEKHMKDYFEEVEISEASKEGKSVMYGMRASMKAMDLRHGVDSDKRDSGYKMSPAVRAAQAKSDALSKVEKPVQAGTLAALKRRAMKKEEVESVDEGVISAVKNAQAKWKTAHRAVYGKDPSLKSMTVGAIARLAGAKASTARAVGAAVGGKPVSAQQQAAAKARAGKVGMAKMRNEEKHEGDDVNANVKGKKAAEKMTKKAAEVRKAKIQGSVNKINMEPTIDLNKKAEK